MWSTKYFITDFFYFNQFFPNDSQPHPSLPRSPKKKIKDIGSLDNTFQKYSINDYTPIMIIKQRVLQFCLIIFYEQKQWKIH